MKSTLFVLCAVAAVVLLAGSQLYAEEKAGEEKAPCKAAVVNTVCPICGKTIDPAKTPEEQTVVYKGHKLGFASVECVAAWNKLTDAEKDAKLQSVLPKPKAAPAPAPKPQPAPAKPEPEKE